MGASVGSMHINFRFHVSCRWKQAYCLRLKSPSCIDFSEWNMTRSYSQMLSSRSSKLLSLISWEKGHWDWWSWWKKRLQAWAAMDLNEERRRTEEKHLFSSPGTFFFKQFHTTSPYPSHSLHHICTYDSTMWPVSNSSPLVIHNNPNPSPLSLPHPKKVSVPTVSRHFLHPLHCLVLCNLPKSLAMGLSPCSPSPSTHCSSHSAFPTWAHCYPGQRKTEDVGLSLGSLSVHTKTACRINPIQNPRSSLQVVLSPTVTK